MFNDHEYKKGEAPSITSYDVGFGKPPKAKQFKPGQSGNPGGRPPGARNKKTLENSLAAVFSKVANSEIPVKDGNKDARMTMLQAVVTATGFAALKGNGRSASNFLALAERVQRVNDAKAERSYQVAKAEYEEFLRTILDYKKSCHEEAARCRAARREPPDFFPAPEHIHLNLCTGVISVSGPWTREELPKWETIWAMVKTYDDRIEEERAKLGCRLTDRARTKIIGAIETLQTARASLVARFDWVLAPPGM